MKTAAFCWLAIILLLMLTGISPAQYNSDGYRHGHDGYYYYGSGSQPYYRTLVSVPGYYAYGSYYQPYSYYRYYAYYPPAQQYTPAAPYAPPSVPSYGADWKVELLKNLKAQGDEKAYLDALKLLYPQGAPMPYVPPAGYAPQYGQPYGYQGHYYQYTVPIQANTQYGYSYQQAATLYGSTDLNLLYQQSAQLALGSQKFASEATAGFQQLVGQSGDNAARIAEIQAKGQVAAALMQAMQSAPAASYKGYSFNVSPGGKIEKIENNVDPKDKAFNLNAFANLVGAKCASCHTGKAPKGGFDIAGYLDLTPVQKQAVWNRLTTDDPQKMMPRSLEGGPGKKLSPDELRLFFLN